jgi:hypothetical protein
MERGNEEWLVETLGRPASHAADLLAVIPNLQGNLTYATALLHRHSQD